MPLTALPPEWMPTRTALQAYSQALTAYPRAGAPSDPRWSHVAMDPTATGFASASTPLTDGSSLESEIDLVGHLIIVSAGEDRLVFELEGGHRAMVRPSGTEPKLKYYFYATARRGKEADLGTAREEALAVLERMAKDLSRPNGC